MPKVTKLTQSTVAAAEDPAHEVVTSIMGATANITGARTTTLPTSVEGTTSPSAAAPSE